MYILSFVLLSIYCIETTFQCKIINSTCDNICLYFTNCIVVALMLVFLFFNFKIQVFIYNFSLFSLIWGSFYYFLYFNKNITILIYFLIANQFIRNRSDTRQKLMFNHISCQNNTATAVIKLICYIYLWVQMKLM